MVGHVESSGWRPFAAGCRAIQVGLLIELIAVYCVLTSLGYVPAQRLFLGPPFSRPAVVDTYGFQLLIPVTLLLVVGAFATAYGRWRMSDLPNGTGARVVLMSCVVFLAMAGHGRGVGAEVLVFGAAIAYGCGLLAGTVAELSALPGVALVAGALPSRRLRIATGRLTVAVLLIAVVWLAVLAAGTTMYFSSRLTPGAGIAGLSPSWRSAVQLIALLLGPILTATYTWVQYRLYSAARSAVHTDPEPTD